MVKGPVGTVTVRDSTFAGNSAGLGGGLYNDGTATVRGSTFTGNSASFSGGGTRRTTSAPVRRR